MKLEGIHHVTCITADAPGNVDFYARLLGLRLVKKTVNQDDPTVYHLFYADEGGSAGADMTFFEYPHARRGRAGAGMVHRVVWRVASSDALDFWERRLGDAGVTTARTDGQLRFSDPEGLDLELAVVETTDAPLVASHPDIPEELALQGFDGVRAYTADPDRSRPLLEETLGFEPQATSCYKVRGERRGSWYRYDDAAGRAGNRRRRHRPPRRLGVASRRPRGLAAGGRTGGRPADADHRPLLLQVDLLPRAERRAVRDRHDRPRLRDRRAVREPRRAPVAAARFRAPAGAGRAPPHAIAEPARLGSQAVSRGRLLLAPLVFCLLAGVFGAAGAGSGTRAATTISFGITDDATKYADDGGAFLFGDMTDLGMVENRVIVFWDENTPRKILEENFVDRMMPVAAAAGIRIVLAIQPIHALAFSTNTPAKVAAFASYVGNVALRWPQVHEFVIGNEPNVKRFFQPQHTPDGSIVSAGVYEQILAASYDTLKGIDPAIKVDGLALSPRGNDQGVGVGRRVGLAGPLHRRARRRVPQERPDDADRRRRRRPRLLEHQHAAADAGRTSGRRRARPTSTASSRRGGTPSTARRSRSSRRPAIRPGPAATSPSGSTRAGRR